MTKRGQKWVEQVTYGLQVLMEQRLSTDNADEIEQKEGVFRSMAFDDHVIAEYINKGKVELSTLPISDLITIIKTIDREDRQLEEGKKQIDAILSYFCSVFGLPEGFYEYYINDGSIVINIVYQNEVCVSTKSCGRFI